MDRIAFLTAENNYFDAEIHRADCIADRQRHRSTTPRRTDDFAWWLNDLVDHESRVLAAEHLLEQRRRALAALKVAA